MIEPVIVIVGAGACGISAARRIAGGRKIVIGSRSHKSLDSAKTSLEHDGFRVETHQVDIADSESTHKFAELAAAAGLLDVVVHTSAVSPVQANGDSDAVLRINLLGTAHVIDAFLPFVGPGTSMICVSSIAAHLTWGYPAVSEALERHFATAPASELLENEDFKKLNEELQTTSLAYSISKRANNLRVEGFVRKYGERGARINSVSPAMIMNPMGRVEIEGSGYSEVMEWTKDCGGMKRFATTEDVSAVIAFLASREASYISGTDIRLDGGSAPGIQWDPICSLASLLSKVPRKDDTAL